MNTRERQKDFKYIYKGSIINMRVDTAILPGGKTANREIVEHPGGVCVLPIDENGDILFIKQFRYPYMEETLEIPAGRRDKAGDSDPLECGKRELKEETGATAQNYTFLGTVYPSPGYTNEVIYVYAATGLNIGKPEPDEGELLNVIKIPFEKAVSMVLSGEITDAKTQIAILKAKNLKDSGKLPLTNGK